MNQKIISIKGISVNMLLKMKDHKSSVLNVFKLNDTKELFFDVIVIYEIAINQVLSNFTFDLRMKMNIK